MVELVDDGLNFSFPDVHPQARLRIEFQRTLRIPDDGREHHLPPGLGCFPLRHVDDFPGRVPRAWAVHGGVMLPMYQSEALWIRFAARPIPDRWTPYPFAIKVAAGKIDAVTGEPWSNDLGARPQDYMVAPEQPWLDGFVVERGLIRQFVAMPLGAGYTAEEQIRGTAEYGGLQILVHPMKREVFERRFPLHWLGHHVGPPRGGMAVPCLTASLAGMGLAPGGQMKQEVYEDPFDFADWDRSAHSRCFVHLTNSLVWEAVTDQKPPTPPPTAALYTRHGLPWFDYYNEGGRALGGNTALKRLRSVLEMAAAKGEPVLPENESIAVDRVVRIGRTSRRPVVRDGAY